MVSAMWKKRGLHWTVCGLVVFLMTTSVSAVVESLTMMSDVDTVTCAGDVSITDPQVCPGRSITFTCTTNETGALVWRTSAGGTDGILFFITDSVGSMGTVAGGGLAGFTANLTSVMGTLLTSTLTTAASDEVRGLQVTCLNGITVSAGSQSTDIPLFVDDPPSQPMTVSATSDSLDCAAGTEDFAVAWQCPADTGGAAITNFTVSVDGGSPQTFMGTAAMSDPIPVAVNEQHSISITASNCFGTGPPNNITVNPEAPVPSVPEDLQVTLNCQNMILNAITVTWNDPNTNLRCSVMSTTVDVDSGDISLSCSGTSSPSVCTGNITENAIYTATVEFSSSLPESQSNPSTSSDQIIGRRCTVDRTLRQMPGDCVQVTLDDWCEEDHTLYGVSVLNQDMSSESAITRFSPSDTICVPIDPTETFSLRLYFNNTVLEEKSGITAVPVRSSSFPVWVIAIIVVPVLLLIAVGFIVGYFIHRHYFEDYPRWLVITIVILCFLLVGIGIALYILIRRYCCSSPEKPRGKPDEHPLRDRVTSDTDAERAVAEETAPTYADPNTIERQPAPDSQDVYTVVDKAKKASKPEDQLQTYQAPESIKREAAPATGELYTVPEAKKGSKKKKEATPAEYTEVDMKKKHQPPSGLMYSELNLPPSGKTPPSKSVEYTDIQPHS